MNSTSSGRQRNCYIFLSLKARNENGADELLLTTMKYLALVPKERSIEKQTDKIINGRMQFLPELGYICLKYFRCVLTPTKIFFLKGAQFQGVTCSGENGISSEQAQYYQKLSLMYALLILCRAKKLQIVTSQFHATEQAQRESFIHCVV